MDRIQEAEEVTSGVHTNPLDLGHSQTYLCMLQIILEVYRSSFTSTAVWSA